MNQSKTTCLICDKVHTHVDLSCYDQPEAFIERELKRQAEEGDDLSPSRGILGWALVGGLIIFALAYAWAHT